jgi:tetratricopeptide (TPR) repeat protein
VGDEGNIAADGVESAILEALQRRAQFEPAEDEEEDEALLASVVTQYLDERSPEPKSRRPTWLIPGGILFAAAAALAIWMVPPGTATPTPAADASPTQALWSLEGSGQSLEGSVVASNEATCGKRPGSRACLKRGGRADFAADGSIKLSEGTLEVEAEKSLRLSLVSIMVQVGQSATFSATQLAEEWSVSVSAGSVMLEGDNLARELGAGESASSTELKTKPGSGADAPEAHGTSAKKVHSADTAAPEAAAKPSATELLDRARARRRAKDFRQAAAAYEDFLESYPKDQKVASTLVSLAQLYQGPLKDPKRALRYYDRYLERGGPLSEEAMYGKIRALRSLGRTQDAKDLSRAFVDQYPSSSYVDSLAAAD